MLISDSVVYLPEDQHTNDGEFFWLAFTGFFFTRIGDGTIERHERKLIHLGRSLVIALPYGYCAAHDLKAGDTVLVETANIIKIRPIQKG